MTMPAWLQPSIEHLVKNYLFYVWVFSMFVICAGIARWYGKRQWYEREKLRRKELGLPIASLLSVGGSSEQSFTYSSLFQGGLLGVRHVVGVLAYSVPFKTVRDDDLKSNIQVLCLFLRRRYAGQIDSATEGHRREGLRRRRRRAVLSDHAVGRQRGRDGRAPRRELPGRSLSGDLRHG
jgi:hypothetical protein